MQVRMIDGVYVCSGIRIVAAPNSRVAHRLC